MSNLQVIDADDNVVEVDAPPPRILVEEDEDDPDIEEEEEEMEMNIRQDDPALDPGADDDRMHLTQHERNLAIHIREAIAAIPHLDPVSDFMCAQLALIDGDNTEVALHRVHHFQCFREEYGVLDTAEDGRRCFAEYMDIFPRIHLHFADAHHMELDQSVMVYDNTQFNFRNIKSEENIKSWMGATYYTTVLFCPDLETIRAGTVLVLECQGHNWKSGVDFKSLKQMWSEVLSVYPVSFSKLKFFNPGMAMNLLFAMLKPFMPDYIRRKHELGCQFPIRLDEVYLVPTLEEANKRFLERVEETLKRRYENERRFRL